MMTAEQHVDEDVDRWRATIRRYPTLVELFGEPPPAKEMLQGLVREYSKALWLMGVGFGTGIFLNQRIPNRSIDIIGTILHPLGLVAIIVVLAVILPIKVWVRDQEELHQHASLGWLVRTSILIFLLTTVLSFGTRLVAFLQQGLI